MARRKILDSDGVEVTPGCVIRFGYGIPPVSVVAPVIATRPQPAHRGAAGR